MQITGSQIISFLPTLNLYQRLKKKTKQYKYENSISNSVSSIWGFQVKHPGLGQRNWEDEESKRRSPVV